MLMRDEYDHDSQSMGGVFEAVYWVSVVGRAVGSLGKGLR
jgi:hypothetical protein